ncbi:ZIP family metal transporter [Clostridium lacusfryxellense]|uniref:ZIP family metal transporter n=1 Tax=Clostridium lacusfryxellense TaxID=205328 RepID=UPI001C0E0619|nr:ZIP family metal transporter [Clostridium lacusfryxellense]MBU3111545.1 ZIP family metal transporter [Clostridium lacusfryxellense]
MNNNIILIIIFSGVMALIGTMLGALLGVVINRPSKKFLGNILGFASGLMLSIVVFELIPDSLEKTGIFGTLLFLILGIIIVVIIDRMSNLSSNVNSQYAKVAFMVAVGLMIHNFPEGLIMGFGFINGDSLGIKMSMIIAIHDVPEGLAVAAPLMLSGIKSKKILFYAFLTALPTAVGAWIGIYIGSISVEILGGALAFASGVMLYVVYGEMIPQSRKLWAGTTSTLGILFGMIVGLLMINVI